MENNAYTTSPPRAASHESPRVEINGNGREHAESIPGLVRGLASDLATLFSKEISLAKAELREAAVEAKAGVVSLATGAALAFAGLLITLMSAVYGLALVVDLWLAALIVGVAALLIGFMMIKAGQSKMNPASFTPERTVESLRKDTEAVKDTARRTA